MVKEKYFDIVNAFSKKSNALLGSSLKSKFLRKVLIFQEFLRGQVSLVELLTNIRKTFWIISPSFLKTKTMPKSLREEIAVKALLKRVFKSYPLSPVLFFENKFHYILSNEASLEEKYRSFLEFVSLVEEIVIADQYCAQEFLKKDSVVIDVGANIGTFSLFASHLSPKGKIYSFEPNSKTFKILKKKCTRQFFKRQLEYLSTGSR